MFEVRKEYKERGWFCRNGGIWVSGPWRTHDAAMLAAEGKYAEAIECDKMDWWKAKKKLGKK